MKTQTLAVAVALAISLVAAGQSNARPRALSANIPFQFEVGKVKMPAGQYEIVSVPTGDGTLQIIRQVDGHASVRFSTIAVEPREEDSKPELVFHRYGNNYFLSQIRSGDGHTLQLFESKQEREAANSQLARAELAVTVALAVR